MKLYFTTLLVLVYALSFSQEKTYFDADWEITTKENAKFYREVEQISDSLYSMNDYYISGAIQMEGFSSDSVKFIYEKTAVWYYENGKKELSAEYKNDKTNGKVIHYLKNGKIKYQGTFVDGKAYNGFILNNCRACIVNVSEYKKGEVVSTNYFYENSSQIAVKRFFQAQKKYSFDNLKADKEVFYDTKNKVIATLFYYNDESGFAYPKSGVEVLFYNNKDREITTIKSKTTYVNHYKDGLFITYSKDGKEFSRGTYKEGKPYSGSIFEYNSLINYEKGVPTGQQIFYDKDGEIFSTATFKDGEIYDGIERDYRSEKIYEKGELMKIITYQDYDFKIKESEIAYENGNDSQRKWYNKQGKLIAECFYVDGRPHDGIDYYSYHNKYTPFVNGMKNGIEKEYTPENEIEEVIDKNEAFIKGNQLIKETRYKDDTIIDVITFLPNTNEKLICLYKNNNPFSGEEFDYKSNTYKNGYIVKEKIFERDYNTNELKLLTINDYKEGTYDKTHQTTFKDNERYELDFEDGRPFNGKKYDDGKLLQYKKGELNGPYFYYEEDSILIEKGNYLDNHKDGKISYTPIDEKPFECIYKEGKPFEGTAIEFGAKNTYKNGEKNGVCYTYYPFKSSQEYVNGKKEGVFTVIVNDFNFRGEYKNDKPYTGSFLNTEAYDIKYQIEHYNEGKKDGIFAEYITGFDIIIETNYNNEILDYKKAIDQNNDSTIAYIEYKNNKPLSGKIVKMNEDGNLVISSYKNGQKNGIEKHYKYSYLTKYSNIGHQTYKDGLKHGSYSKSYQDNDYKTQTVKGFYKKGKPFKGIFLQKTEYIITLSNYKNGKKDGIESYQTDSRKSVLIYKKGVPFNGEMLEHIGKYYSYYYTHYYKNGRKEKIGIQYYDGEVEFTEFENTIQYKNNDEIVTVNYSNSERTDATIIYSKEDIEIGRFIVKNNIVISGKLTLNVDDGYYNLHQEVKDDKIISKIFSLKHKDVYYKYTTRTIFGIDSLNYTNFKILKDGLEPQVEELDFAIYKNGKIISKLELSKKGVENGVMVTFPSFFEKDYTLTLIENGEQTTTIEDVKYEHLETEIDKLNKQKKK